MKEGCSRYKRQQINRDDIENLVEKAGAITPVNIHQPKFTMESGLEILYNNGKSKTHIHCTLNSTIQNKID